MVKMLKAAIIILFFASLAVAESKSSNAIMVSAKDTKYFGDESAKPPLYKKYAKEIKSAEQYLNSFYTLSAQFKQSNKNDEISYGKLFISKPGKIRCEYSSPSPLLLIMNDQKITYYDKELDEISYTNTDINALKFLALNEIKFSELNLIEVIKEANFIALSVQEYSKELKQNLIVTFQFNYPSTQLRQLIITTEESEVNVIFDNLIYNKALGKQLFYFNRPSSRKYK
jgi:outer membrane lipoprotein-sorting protein